MRKILMIGAVVGACAGCTTPPAPSVTAIQPAGVASTAAANDPLVCRTIVGQTDVDGSPQRIVGNACRQPDGSWQIDTGEAVLYPVYPYYDPWYDPWLVWPTAVIGGGGFVFFDRFHHFHHHDHPGWGGPWHGRGARSAGAMHAGGGMFMSAGGARR